MPGNIAFFTNTTNNKIIFLLSIIVSVIFVLSQSVNVYQFAVVGAIFEIIWLPVLVSILILTVTSVRLWFKDKFNFRSLNLYSLLIILLTIIFTILFI
jgi:threonine/homoserine/homoserine lactone efflux protein